MIIFVWLLTAIAVEALVELLTTASIFEIPRAKLMAKSKFIEELLSCGYCTSVWIAAILAWALPSIIEYSIIDIIVKTLALHRLSNFIHEIRALWNNGLQINHLVHKAGTEDINNG